MRIARPLALVLLLAAACGGDGDAGPAPGDYFAQLQRVSQTAHIQERGLRRDLRPLREAGGQDRMAVVSVFLDQSARLYQDVLDALGAARSAPRARGCPASLLDAWKTPSISP